MLEAIRNWWANKSREPATFSVVCDETRLTQTAREGESIESWHIEWDSVTAVFAYKRDLFAADQIRIVIATADPHVWVEVSEEDEGYGQLVKQMPIRLPGCPAYEEWLELVRLPPFAPQWTQIYARAQRA